MVLVNYKAELGQGVLEMNFLGNFFKRFKK